MKGNGLKMPKIMRYSNKVNHDRVIVKLINHVSSINIFFYNFKDDFDLADVFMDIKNLGKTFLLVENNLIFRSNYDNKIEAYKIQMLSGLNEYNYFTNDKNYIKYLINAINSHCDYFFIISK